MRVSAVPSSPHYKGSESYEVWLNGKRVSNVIEACDEAGWLIRDKDFDVMQLQSLDNSLPAYSEILRGRVTIVSPRLLPVPTRNRFTAEEVCAAFGVPLQSWQLEILNWLVVSPRELREMEY